MPTKKNTLVISDMHSGESLSECCLFGCECSFSLHRFAYQLEKNFDLPLVRHIEKTKMLSPSVTDAKKNLPKNTLSLWDTLADEYEEDVFYAYTEADSGLLHRVYAHKQKFFHSPAAIKEYGFVRYWWLVNGRLQNAHAFADEAMRKMKHLPEVYFFEQMNLEKMLELPHFIFG